MKCIGFDTSNYTTSVACFSPWVYKNCSRILPVPEGSRGLRQSDALFQHTRVLPELIKELIEEVSPGCTVISVSETPRRVEGSYMPCFLAGVLVAEALSKGMGVPLYRFSHQEGHLAAAAWSAGCPEMLFQPFLAWHLSGGTTELLLCEPKDDFTFHTKTIGGTLDLSAGQCVDRAGVLMDISFPCGQKMEKLALSGKTSDRYMPKLDGLWFNLSGMENQFTSMYKRNIKKEDVAFFVLRSIEEILVTISKKALIQYPGLPILCSGGVMSCLHLQDRLKKEFDAKTAQPNYSRDNAMGIAILGYMKEGGCLDCLKSCQ